MEIQMDHGVDFHDQSCIESLDCLWKALTGAQLSKEIGHMNSRSQIAKHRNQVHVRACMQGNNLLALPLSLLDNTLLQVPTPNSKPFKESRYLIRSLNELPCICKLAYTREYMHTCFLLLYVLSDFDERIYLAQHLDVSLNRGLSFVSSKQNYEARPKVNFLQQSPVSCASLTFDTSSLKKTNSR
jgi:hypothetical protein